MPKFEVELRGKEVTTLAEQIATEDSIGLIDCHLSAVRDRRGRLLWYDLGSADEHSRWFVDRAVRYLELRGLLRRHATRPAYINWRTA